MSLKLNSLKKLFCFLFLYTIACYADGNVQLIRKSPYTIESQDGSIVNLSYLIINNTGSQQNFVLKMELPENWSLMFSPSPFILENGGSKVIISSIKIPKNIQSNLYNIKALLQGVSSPSITAINSSKIFIIPHRSIEARVLSQPKYVICGDYYQVDLELVNNGNIQSEIKIEPRELNKHGFNITPYAPTLKLDAMETKKTSVLVKTSDDLSHYINHKINFEIKTIDELEKTSTKATSNVNVFPKYKEKPQKFVHFPMKTSFKYGLANQKQEMAVEIGGKGPINDDKDKNLEIFFRGVIIDEKRLIPDFGYRPERMVLHYHDKSRNFLLGDGQRTVSPLLMLYRYGRGASLKLTSDHLQANLLYIKQAVAYPIEQIGGFLKFLSNDIFELSLNLLRYDIKQNYSFYKPKEYCATSIYNKTSIKPLKSTIELEYANNVMTNKHLGNSQSFYGNLEIRPFKSTYLILKGIYAQPIFFGYYKDQKQYIGNCGFPIFLDNLRFNFSYNRYIVNLKKDVSRNYANRNNYVFTGLSYSFPFGLYSNFSYNNTMTKDILNTYSNHSKFFRLILNQHITNKFLIQVSGNIGSTSVRTTYHLHDFTKSGGRLFLNYRPTNFQSYELSANGDYEFSTLRKKVDFLQRYIFSGKWKSVDNKMIAGFQCEISPKNDFYKQFIRGNFSYKFNKDHELSLFARYYNESKYSFYIGSKSLYEFLVSYTIPWFFPVNKKKINGIKGKVRDTSLNPVYGASVVCDNKMVMTDQKGEFEFYSLKKGMHNIFMENKNDKEMANIELPIQVDIKDNEIKEFNIDMVKACQIMGQINVYKFDALNDDDDKKYFFDDDDSKELMYKKDKGLKNIKINAWLEGENEIRQITTNEDGVFQLDCLKEGLWHVKVQETNIPYRHFIEENIFSFYLSQGEERFIDIKVLPKKIKVKMID